MILNKYFLEEKRFAITLQSTKQHNTILQQRTHFGKPRTWWDRFRIPVLVIVVVGAWRTGQGSFASDVTQYGTARRDPLCESNRQCPNSKCNSFVNQIGRRQCPSSFSAALIVLFCSRSVYWEAAEQVPCCLECELLMCEKFTCVLCKNKNSS